MPTDPRDALLTDAAKKKREAEAKSRNARNRRARFLQPAVDLKELEAQARTRAYYMVTHAVTKVEQTLSKAAHNRAARGRRYFDKANKIELDLYIMDQAALKTKVPVDPKVREKMAKDQQRAYKEAVYDAFAVGQMYNDFLTNMKERGYNGLDDED